jgi:ADP-ribose pyrophosphatase
MPWKLKSSKEIYREEWMQITVDNYQIGRGKLLTHAVIHKDPYALIIPWDGKKFILVGQHRYVIDFYSWEFPAGHFHSSIKETAELELKEETGYTAKNIRPLGFVYLAPGHHTQQCHVFLATSLKKGKTKRDEGEKAANMKTKKVTPQQLEKMIWSGKIKDGPTLAAYSLLRASGLLKF